MKKNLIYLLFSVTLLCAALTACSDNDDLDSTSVVRPTTTEQNDLDRWLKRNYVETYNIQLKYRFEDIESSMGYYLTPASYKQSVAMAKLERHMCLEAYDEITGSTDFNKAYFPKILFLDACMPTRPTERLCWERPKPGRRSRSTTSTT